MQVLEDQSKFLTQVHVPGTRDKKVSAHTPKVYRSCNSADFLVFLAQSVGFELKEHRINVEGFRSVYRCTAPAQDKGCCGLVSFISLE